jgi:glycosyltransferase involved in cell wall biosynthesis
VVEAVEFYARRKSKKIISISPYVRNEIRRHLINSQVIDVENPVENEFFEVIRAPDKNRLLYVGRINERKNIKTLIEAFALFYRINIEAKLTIAGDYDEKSYFQECEKIVDDLGLNDSVEFIGGIDRGRLVEELKTTSCLILVSLQETAPMIVEEAMSAGVPVVASNICGLPYMIEDGVSGYLVNAQDKNDIAEKIESIALDKEKNIAMGERAREIAKDRFHYLSVARKTIAIYENSL